MAKNYIDELRAIMGAAGQNQVQLAKTLGVTFAALNRWLNRHAVPHPAMRLAIHQLYKEKVGSLPLSAEEIKEILAKAGAEKKEHRGIGELIKTQQRLREDLLLELTYNSNAIEGSALTKKETEAIIFDRAKIKDKSYAEHLEATNHAAALQAVFNGEFAGHITESKIKYLNRIVLQGISPDAGKYSKHHRAIRGVNLQLPGPEDIQEEMNNLLKSINRPKHHPIEHIAREHAAFEAIHPFGDGNGRVGRLIMIIQLLDADYAPCLIENNRKAEYYEDLELAQKKSESRLIKFIAESILRGYQLIRKHKK